MRRALLAAAQICGRLVAVHVGHLAVHQDGVVALRGERLERLAPVADDVGATAAALERADGDDLVDGAVLGDQHERRRTAPRRTGGAFISRGFLRRRRRADRLAEVELEPERAAAARLALGADRSAHQLDQLAGDREAEAGAAVVARRRGVGLRERLEHAVERSRVDADAGVGDLEADPTATGAGAPGPR